MADHPCTICNFSHPLRPDHLRQIEDLLGAEVGQLIERTASFDDRRPFAAQAASLVASIPLRAADWQSQRLVVNLPGHHAIAALVLAELHGRTGGFPPVLRLARVPPHHGYAVVEILDLQAVRQAGRRLRLGA